MIFFYSFLADGGNDLVGDVADGGWCESRSVIICGGALLGLALILWVVVELAGLPWKYFVKFIA